MGTLCKQAPDSNHDGTDDEENATKKGLMSRTMVLHVRYRSLYISLLSSEQQREITTFPVFWKTPKTELIFGSFI